MNFLLLSYTKLNTVAVWQSFKMYSVDSISCLCVLWYGLQWPVYMSHFLSSWSLCCISLINYNCRLLFYSLFNLKSHNLLLWTENYGLVHHKKFLQASSTLYSKQCYKKINAISFLQRKKQLKDQYLRSSSLSVLSSQIKSHALVV